jgi:hypothetical protein
VNFEKIKNLMPIYTNLMKFKCIKRLRFGKPFSPDFLEFTLVFLHIFSGFFKLKSLISNPGSNFGDFFFIFNPDSTSPRHIPQRGWPASPVLDCVRERHGGTSMVTRCSELKNNCPFLPAVVAVGKLKVETKTAYCIVTFFFF